MVEEPWLERLKLPHPSLGPPRYPEPEAGVYGEAIDRLAAEGVPFLLAGALALNIHTGIWRSTKDLDFFLRAGDLGRAHAALERGGFMIEVLDEVWLSKGWKRGVFVDLIHANANGLMPVDDEWYAHAVTAEVLGRRTRVAAREEVILSKMFVAARERFDGADVLHLLYHSGGRLDWARLLRKAGPDAGLLLGHLHHFQWAYPQAAHLVPPEVLAEAGRLAAEARGSAVFRGMFLDPVQFSIDVTAFGLPNERAAARARTPRASGDGATAR